ncbi:MAG: hypothetical protein ACP5JG_00130 [Anaerolineae bacterium]
MKTDWQLIRDVMNATIDACEELEALEVTAQEKGDPQARWGDYETGVSVGDFFDRFWRYPEGSQRDIIRLRSRLGIGDQKYYSEFARALINTAAACAEIIGVSQEDLDRQDEGFESHCGSAGTSIRYQLERIGWIYENWMIPEVTDAIKRYREGAKA